MNRTQTLAATMILAAATQLQAQPPHPGPPPSASGNDLQKAQDDLAKCQADLTAAKAYAATLQSKDVDWAQLKRYQADNAALPPASTSTLPADARVVFYGDSITDAWGRRPDTGDFFPGRPYINRGISGQTTPQMLVRFEQDVVHLHPAAVLILAGTNDIAGNTGPSTPQMIEDNFAAMVAIARQNNIKVILASITPAAAYPWKPGIDPVPAIRQLNQWLQNYANTQRLTYVDYYSAMATPNGAMKPGLSFDGVHPTAKGYAIMGPLAQVAIAQALRK
jgi:lysophospholipase L1-like esterase